MHPGKKGRRDMDDKYLKEIMVASKSTAAILIWENPLFESAF